MLKPPTSGLRVLHLNAVSPAKVALVVAPGDELHVSEDVAEQLIAADGHFADGPSPFTDRRPGEPVTGELTPAVNAAPAEADPDTVIVTDPRSVEEPARGRSKARKAS
jgi:hypothetical protein